MSIFSFLNKENKTPDRNTSFALKRTSYGIVLEEKLIQLCNALCPMITTWISNLSDESADDLDYSYDVRVCGSVMAYSLLSQIMDTKTTTNILTEAFVINYQKEHPTHAANIVESKVQLFFSEINAFSEKTEKLFDGNNILKAYSDALIQTVTMGLPIFDPKVKLEVYMEMSNWYTRLAAEFKKIS